MIMRVGGRFPYLQELESVTAPGNKKVYGNACMCVPSLNLSVCVNMCKHKALRYLMDL